MKKLLVLMVVGFGTIMAFKGGYVSVAADHVRVARWSIPLPAIVQASPVMAMVTTLLQGNLQPAAAAPRPAAPPLPSVGSAIGTFNANAQGNTNAPQGRAAAQGTDQLNAVSKALR